MNIKDIILFILVIVIIYLIYKTRNLEKLESFTTDTEIISAVNNQYKTDMEAIINVGKVLDYIKNNNNSLNIIPFNTITDRLIVKGDLEVDGKINITGRDTKILEIFPKYMVIAWGTSSGSPKGWALCDGKSYILNLDGTVSISTLSTAIKTPDLKGRFILGAGAGTNLINRTLDNPIGGFENHILTLDQLPKHSHSILEYGNSQNSEALSHVAGQYSANKHQAGDTGYTGGGGSHNNMPPFYVLYYIMKL
jgi:microcystin-dependent protein